LCAAVWSDDCLPRLRGGRGPFRSRLSGRAA